MLCAGPVESLALREGLRLYEIEIAVLEGHYIKQARVGIVRGREPIRGAHNAGADVGAFLGWDAIGKERTARSINSFRPVQFLHKWSRTQELAIGSVQNIEETIAVRLEQEMTHGAGVSFVH